MDYKPKIYIAGPLYSSGHVAENIRAATTAAAALHGAGFSPYVPHYTHFAHLIGWRLSVDQWLEHDHEWLSACDAVLRLPGVSEGADKEVMWAAEENIPVFYLIDTLIKNKVYLTSKRKLRLH